VIASDFDPGHEVLARRLAPQHTAHDEGSDAARHRRQPVRPAEDLASDAGVAFDPEGWDEFYAPR
jgi:hypothetical protein